MSRSAQQLEHILDEEKIVHEPRALQLLARAADGSLRDALSLTDQAIASGDGKLSTDAGSTMLGTLDDDQALSLIEAMIAANGERVMSQVNEAASRGVEWEGLLVEMLAPAAPHGDGAAVSPARLGADMAAIEQRMRELARTVPPADVQLYYQTLLIGRKELPFAPDPRMGVEMTLLRALAFHPQASHCRSRKWRASRCRRRPRRPLPRQRLSPKPQPLSAAQPQMAPPPDGSPPPADDPDMAPAPDNLPDATSQLLAGAEAAAACPGSNQTKKE